MERALLDIRLQMEALISEREGMIAGNLQRVHLEEAMAYGESEFLTLERCFTSLIETLRSL